MNSLKHKRLKRLMQELKDFNQTYPQVAGVLGMVDELSTLLGSVENQPHPRLGGVPVEASTSSALQEVAKRIPLEGLALAGGLAVLHWIDTRTTFDVDFVVMPASLNGIEKALPGGMKNSLIYTVTVGSTAVDFLLPDRFPWNAEAIERAATETVMGIRMKVLTPEYLILYKLLAARDRDLLDIKSLLTLPGVKLKARELVQKYLPNDLDDFDQLASLSFYGL